MATSEDPRLSYSSQNGQPLSITDLKKEEDGAPRLRQKSTGFMQMEDTMSEPHMRAFLKQQKTCSDYEVLDLKQIAVVRLHYVTKLSREGDPSSQNSSMTKLIAEHRIRSLFPSGFSAATIYQVFLARIIKLLDCFLRSDPSCSIEDHLDTSKKVIGDFEHLKADLEEAKASDSADLSFETEDLRVLNFLIVRIRFILSRFGRLISVYEVLLQKFIEEADKETKARSALNFSKMMEQKWRSSRQDGPNRGLKDKHSLSLKLEETEQVQDTTAAKVLGSLSEAKKSHVITNNCFKEIIAVWRSEFEKERLAFVPPVTCRICQQKFYANLAARHAQFCNLKKDAIKKQRFQNDKICDISYEILKRMVKLEKSGSTMSSQTGTAKGSRRSSIVSTSSFQFLNRLGLERTNKSQINAAAPGKISDQMVSNPPLTKKVIKAEGSLLRANFSFPRKRSSELNQIRQIQAGMPHLRERNSSPTMARQMLADGNKRSSQGSRRMLADTNTVSLQKILSSNNVTSKRMTPQFQDELQFGLKRQSIDRLESEQSPNRLKGESGHLRVPNSAKKQLLKQQSSLQNIEPFGQERDSAAFTFNSYNSHSNASDQKPSQEHQLLVDDARQSKTENKATVEQLIQLDGGKAKEGTLNESILTKTNSARETSFYSAYEITRVDVSRTEALSEQLQSAKSTLKSAPSEEPTSPKPDVKVVPPSEPSNKIIERVPDTPYLLTSNFLMCELAAEWILQRQADQSRATALGLRATLRGEECLNDSLASLDKSTIGWEEQRQKCKAYWDRQKIDLELCETVAKDRRDGASDTDTQRSVVAVGTILQMQQASCLQLVTIKALSKIESRPSMLERRLIKFRKFGLLATGCLMLQDTSEVDDKSNSDACSSQQPKGMNQRPLKNLSKVYSKGSEEITSSQVSASDAEKHRSASMPHRAKTSLFKPPTASFSKQYKQSHSVGRQGTDGGQKPALERRMSLVYDVRSVDNELKILNVIKLLSSDAFKLCSDDEFSFQQKRSILQLQQERIEELKKLEKLSSVTQEVIGLYVEDLATKIKTYSQNIIDEKRYYNTMPQSIYEAKQAEENLNQEKLRRYEHTISLTFKMGESLRRPRQLRSKKKSESKHLKKADSLIAAAQAAPRSMSIAPGLQYFKKLQLVKADKENNLLTEEQSCMPVTTEVGSLPIQDGMSGSSGSLSSQRGALDLKRKNKSLDRRLDSSGYMGSQSTRKGSKQRPPRESKSRFQGQQIESLQDETTSQTSKLRVAFEDTPILVTSSHSSHSDDKSLKASEGNYEMRKSTFKNQSKRLKAQLKNDSDCDLSSSSDETVVGLGVVSKLGHQPQSYLFVDYHRQGGPSPLQVKQDQIQGSNKGPRPQVQPSFVTSAQRLDSDELDDGLSPVKEGQQSPNESVDSNYAADLASKGPNLETLMSPKHRFDPSQANQEHLKITTNVNKNQSLHFTVMSNEYEAFVDRENRSEDYQASSAQDTHKVIEPYQRVRVDGRMSPVSDTRLKKASRSNRAKNQRKGTQTKPHVKKERTKSQNDASMTSSVESLGFQSDFHEMCALQNDMHKESDLVPRTFYPLWKALEKMDLVDRDHLRDVESLSNSNKANSTDYVSTPISNAFSPSSRTQKSSFFREKGSSRKRKQRSSRSPSQASKSVKSRDAGSLDITVERLYESSGDNMDSVSSQSGSSEGDVAKSKNLQSNTYKQLVSDQNLRGMADDQQDEDQSEEDSFEPITMADVKFSSCTNLPSMLDCCQLDYVQGEYFGENVAIQDFVLLKSISSGAYGRVVLARKKKTNDIFAIKVLDKQVMVEKNVKEFVINERDILTSLDNDFIVRGIYTFQSRKYLYMVMEFMKGGDFGTLLEQVGCFNYERAKFYLAHLVAALEHLHSKGVIHRDLKPQNMLIAADGHVKLTDFGLSEAGMLQQLKESENKPADKGDSAGAKGEGKEDALDEDIAAVLGGPVAMRKEELELLEKAKPNYDDFNLQTSWSMKKKFVFAKPGKKRYVSQCAGRSSSTAGGMFGASSRLAKKARELKKQAAGEEEKEKLKKKNRILGTADYMAPEVIKGDENGPALDFWSLGIIGYEFFTGNLPFNDETPQKVFQNILNKDIEWPEEGEEEFQIHPNAKDFLVGLLERDPKKRLGGERGVAELKEHPFLADVNWQTLITDPAPWVPFGKAEDVSNFPNAKDDDLCRIIEQETKEDFAQVQQASMTMKFNQSPIEQLKASMAGPTTKHTLMPESDKMTMIQGSSFENFQRVSYKALESINQKEATREMNRVDRMLKKMKDRGQEILKKDRFSNQNEALISQTVSTLPKDLINSLRKGAEESKDSKTGASDPKKQSGASMPKKIGERSKSRHKQVSAEYQVDPGCMTVRNINLKEMNIK